MIYCLLYWDRNQNCIEYIRTDCKKNIIEMFPSIKGIGLGNLYKTSRNMRSQNYSNICWWIYNCKHLIPSKASIVIDL